MSFRIFAPMDEYRYILSRLRQCYDEGEARAVAFLLLEDGFGITRRDVYADKVKAFSTDEREELEKMLTRLCRREPVQYVLGRARFCGRDFRVNTSTLIPRPETEGLVTHAERLARELFDGKKFSVLDAGTGSGCIAITLALRFPEAEVEAWDISPEALKMARENAEFHGTKVRFRCFNMLDEAAKFVSSRPAILISNPPYVRRSEAAEMEAHVLDYEPHGALFVPDESPLLFYRALARLAAAQPFVGVAVETNCAFAEDVAELFLNAGYASTEVLQDEFNRPRYVLAVRR